MAKFVIQRAGDRYFIKKTISKSEKGVDITDAVGYIIAKYNKIPDGGSVTLYNRNTTPNKLSIESIAEARGLAEQMRDIIKGQTGVDCLEGVPSGQATMHRAMIAYRLKLLGYTWVVAASAVDRTIPSCTRINPMRFISDNEDSLWNKILNVR